MRNMSFMLTTQQIIDETKDVTRRLGWDFLKPGDRIQACRKCQGLRRGEKLDRLKVIEVVDVRREPLQNIRHDDVDREGFPGRRREWFIDHFCKSMKCQPTDQVNRILFNYVDDDGNVKIRANWLDNLRHMLGASPAERDSSHGYRNHFCAEVGYSDHTTMLQMAAAGLVTAGRKLNAGREQYFYATRAGCEAIGLSTAAIKRALED